MRWAKKTAAQAAVFFWGLKNRNYLLLSRSIFSRWKWLASIKQPATTQITNKICQIFMRLSQWMSGGLIRCCLLWYAPKPRLFNFSSRIIAENRQRWLIPLQSGHMPLGHHYSVPTILVPLSCIAQKAHWSWIRVPANTTQVCGKSRGSEPRGPEPRGMKLFSSRFLQCQRSHLWRLCLDARYLSSAAIEEFLDPSSIQGQCQMHREGR